MPVHFSGSWAEQIDTVCRSLAARGHEVDVITTRHPVGFQLEKTVDNMAIHYLRETSPGRYTSSWWLESVRRFEKLGKAGYDIVYSQGRGGLAYLKKLRKRVGIPYITHERGTILREALSNLYEGVTAGKVFAFLRNSCRYVVRDFQRIRQADRIVAVSEYVKKGLARIFLISPESIDVVRNFVNSNRFNDNLDGTLVKERYKISRDEKLILAVGRIYPQKGFQYLIGSLPLILGSCKNAKVMIVGPGNYSQRLIEMAMRLRIRDKIILTGPIHHRSLPSYYAAADVVVNPTVRRNEGMVNVVLEAFASGKPVVASDVGGCRELIEYGVDGLLVPPHDCAGLAVAVSQVLKNCDVAVRLGRAGRKKATQMYTLDKTVNSLSKVFEASIGFGD
jgi:glycosyltransferase involved in cell wall biosynthesis